MYSDGVRAHLLVAWVAATVSTASAAPAADIVVAWSPQPLGPTGERLSEAAARAGAAYIDASPTADPLPDPRPLIRRGITAYGNLELEGAINSLDAAADLVDQTGAAGLDSTTLGDLFLYRALAHTTRGNDPKSWDDFVVVAGIQPTRVLDPAGFPPRVIDRFGQARAHVAALPRGTVTLASGARCRVRIDGVIVTASEVELPFGRHWVDATCEARTAVRRRLDVDRVTLEVKIAGPQVAPPDDAALLVQARVASARALVIVFVQGRTALVRKLGIDGKERDRQTLALSGAGSDRSELAAALGRMLEAPRPGPREPWYQSRWVWGAAGVAIAGAILIPFAVRNSGSAPEVVVRPDGMPAW